MIKMEELKKELPYVDYLPSHWSIVPNRYLFRYDGKKVGQDFSKYQLLSLTKEGVKEKDINAGGGKVPDSYDNYQTVKKGQMIFCLFDLDCSAVFSGLSSYDGMITSAYDVFTPTDLIEGRYADYWFKYVFTNRYYMLFSKNIRYTVSSDIFNALKTPVPPMEEQQRIADFLDKKCSQIERLIKLQEKEIEKLKDYKQSIISESITKNYSGQKVIDSGFSWIGQVPEDYIISRLKFALKEQMMYGANESGERLVNTEDCYRYIRITDITSDNKLKDNEENLYLTKEKAQGFILNKKDILFARSGGTVGKTFMYEGEDNKSAFAGYLIKARCDETKLLPEFLMYFTQSSIYERWKNMVFIQATIQNIGANKYSNMELVLPPIDKQRKIVNLLDSKTKTIIDLIEKKEAKIQKLKDFKQSLIYECVTGKKEI